MYRKVAPMFVVENVDKPAEWYKGTFSARLQASLPKEPPFEWVSLMLDDVEIMFSKKKSAQKCYSESITIAERPANFIAYIYVEDANKLYGRIKDKLKTIMQPVDQWYGIREFVI